MRVFAAGADGVAMASPDWEQDEHLAESLGVLASAARLRLLRGLRRPARIGEIELRIREPDRGPEAMKLVSRQGVTWHIDQLIEAGLVRRLPAEGRGDRYVLDHQRLFVLFDELQQLTKLRPLALGGGDEGTLRGEGPASPMDPTGPQLLVVYGRDEGTTFGLEDGQGPWVIGRAEGSDVRLDYDPFVSSEHARVVWEDDGILIEDLGSSNGTAVNGHQLEPGEPAKLDPGAVVSLGRTRLVFQA